MCPQHDARKPIPKCWTRWWRISRTATSVLYGLRLTGRQEVWSLVVDVVDWFIPSAFLISVVWHRYYRTALHENVAHDTEQSAGHLLSNAKILLSAAYPSCRKTKSANERNRKEALFRSCNCHVLSWDTSFFNAFILHHSYRGFLSWPFLAQERNSSSESVSIHCWVRISSVSWRQKGKVRRKSDGFKTVFTDWCSMQSAMRAQTAGNTFKKAGLLKSHCTLVWLRPEKAYQKSKVTKKFVKKKERESAKIRAYFETRLTLLPNTQK